MEGDPDKEVRRRLETIGLQLLVDAGVRVVSHGAAALLEQRFIMFVATSSGPYYFKFFPDPTTDELRSESRILATLSGEVERVPRPFMFATGEHFVSRAWPHVGMAVLGTSQMSGDTHARPDHQLLLQVAARAAEMHTILDAHAHAHHEVRLRTDYQQLLQIYLSYRTDLTVLGLATLIEDILDKGLVDRPVIAIHGDLRDRNFVVEEPELQGIIDFSDTRRSVREDDIGRLIQHLLYTHGFSWTDLVPVLDAYGEISGYGLDLQNLSLSVAFNTLFRFVRDRPSEVDKRA